MFKLNFGFKVKVYESIPVSFQKQIEQMWDVYFGDPKRTPIEQAEHDDRFCSSKDRFATILAVEEKKVIGLVGVLKRKVNFKDKKIILGGFGGVCTREDRRGRGVATTLLARAMEELKKAGCDVVYLCANPEKGPKLYGPFGFVFLTRQYTYRGKSGKRYSEDYGMIAPVNSKAVFAEIIADENPFDIGVGNW